MTSVDTLFVFQKHLEEGTVDLWLEQGGDPHAHDRFSSTLSMAVFQTSMAPAFGLRAVKALLKAGARWSYPEMRNNALVSAAEEGLVEAVRTLLDFAPQQTDVENNPSSTFQEASKVEVASLCHQALKGAIKGSSAFQHVKNTGGNEHIQRLFERRAECVALLYPIVQEHSLLIPPKSLLRLIIEEAKSGIRRGYSEEYLSAFLPILKGFSSDIDEHEKLDLLDISLSHSRYPVTPRELRAMFEFDMSLNSTQGTNVAFLYIMNELHNPSDNLGDLAENIALLEEHGFSWTSQGSTGKTMAEILTHFLEHQKEPSARMSWIRARYETHLLAQHLPHTMDLDNKSKVRL